MTGKRNIAAIALRDFTPEPVPTAQPEVTWIDPRDLLVDEAYQRDLSERSIALIRRIATGWDWRRYKAPSCAWTDEGLEVIDGQHTAIGAACRDDIPQIPVLITEAREQADRAAAFIGLNRDRVGITATQLHAAAVTAGDAEAMEIELACEHAGIVVLKSPPGPGRFAPRTTMAVAAIGALIKRNAAGAVMTLQALAGADLAPIQANQIKAADLLLTDPEFGGPEVEDITKAILAAGADAEKDARLFSATHCVPVWRGLAAVWFKKMPKRRKPVITSSTTNEAEKIIEPASAPSPSQAKAPSVGPRSSSSGPEAPSEPLEAAAERSPEPPQLVSAIPRAAVAILDDMKVDTRSAKGGWAPGRHIRRCAHCDCRFQGAISATRCADCAYGGQQDG